MAGKPKSMSQIKQLLRLHKEGNGNKSIARILGISKNTVKLYLQKVEQSRLDIDSLLQLEDPVLESKFHPGNPAYKQERYEHLKSNLDYYTKELNRKGVTKNLLWEEYKKGYPNGYSRSQFCYHLSQHITAAKPTMVLHHKPGEKLYIDFAGKPLTYIDTSTGELVKCQVFVACLPYSDYSFAMAVQSQSIEHFLYALRCCLEDIGGAPELLVPDNLKSAITKANKYEPEINRAMEDFANHYNTTVVPARVRKPRDKALVENQVKIIYTRVYARLRNSEFHSLASLNEGVKESIRLHNQTRMQHKPYCREERFLADEKHRLKSLPEQSFELKYYRNLKVAQNNHILLMQDKHYYSVPFAYIGKQAKVIYTRNIVYIYIDGKRVAVHVRSYKQGGYTTDKEHLCSTHNHYLNRSPEYYINMAKSKNSEFAKLTEQIFKQNKHPEQLYKTCDGLLNLQRKTNAEHFTKACSIALTNGIFSYRAICNLIENKANFSDDVTGTNNTKPLPKHDNIRGGEYYKNRDDNQLTINFNH